MASRTCPTDGCLLVGPLTIYGFLDLWSTMAEVGNRRRLVIRGLGEHAHYAVPVWRDLLAACGMVRGTRDNVRALMGDRQTILVFPGGAREVNKRRGQQYQLLWRERIGFARLAIEQGYPIVPFAAVGADDMLDVIVDQNDADATASWPRLYEKVHGLPDAAGRPRGRADADPPPRATLFLVRRADRQHSLRQPLSTTPTAARALRDEVKQAILVGIQFLRDERDQDPHRSLLSRLRGHGE